MPVNSDEERESLDQFFDDYMVERKRVLEREGKFEFNDAELKKACELIVIDGENIPDPTDDYNAPDAIDKANKNHLDGEVLDTIREDLDYGPRIAAFIDKQACFDDHFPEKLKANFLKIYDDCLARQMYGNEIFREIVAKLTKRAGSLKDKITVELVLVHYFSLCEVFPKDGPGTAEAERRRA